MSIQCYRAVVSRREYKENCQAIKRADDILSGKMKPRGGNPNLVRVDQLSCTIEPLTKAVKHEKGTGLATDFAVDAMPKMKSLARKMINAPEGKMLQNRLFVLDCLLPTTEPAPPVIEGGFGFEKMVREVCGKLPRSARQKISNVTFYEVDSNKISGLTAHTKHQVILVVKGHDNATTRHIIAHEIAHVWLDSVSPEANTEANADAQAAAWGFPRQ